jgi:hypothetical protein
MASGGTVKTYQPHIAPVLSDNPFIKDYNEQRGYASCEITTSPMRAVAGSRIWYQNQMHRATRGKPRGPERTPRHEPRS